MTLMTFKTAIASEEPLDMAFLEWLGATTEIESLGVNIDGLLQAQEQKDIDQTSEDNSQ